MSNFDEYFLDKYIEGVEKARQEGYQEGYQEGIEEFQKEGILKMIRNYIESTGTSVQDTFEILKIPETDRGFYLKKLQQA